MSLRHRGLGEVDPPPPLEGPPLGGCQRGLTVGVGPERKEKQGQRARERALLERSEETWRSHFPGDMGFIQFFLSAC